MTAIYVLLARWHNFSLQPFQPLTGFVCDSFRISLEMAQDITHGVPSFGHLLLNNCVATCCLQVAQQSMPQKGSFSIFMLVSPILFPCTVMCCVHADEQQSTKLIKNFALFSWDATLSVTPNRICLFPVNKITWRIPLDEVAITATRVAAATPKHLF